MKPPPLVIEIHKFFSLLGGEFRLHTAAALAVFDLFFIYMGVRKSAFHDITNENERRLLIGMIRRYNAYPYMDDQIDVIDHMGYWLFLSENLQMEIGLKNGDPRLWSDEFLGKILGYPCAGRMSSKNRYSLEIIEQVTGMQLWAMVCDEEVYNSSVLEKVNALKCSMNDAFLLCDLDFLCLVRTSFI